MPELGLVLRFENLNYNKFFERKTKKEKTFGKEAKGCLVS